MQQKINFIFWNNSIGWLVFLLSLTIYFITLEPTVSFWDCGEFIASAAKLEISHAPGAPLFMLLGRLAVILYPSNPAIMINGMSAVASSLTILFLFWTITWFGRKIFKSEWKQSKNKQIIILLSGFIGSMAYAFTDSFWFSAVEAEVYALSSMLTALAFWCILKWEENFDNRINSERWLLFIAYLFGLSIGVHLLNLLVIPAIVLLYMVKRYSFSAMVLFKAIGISLLLLLVFLIVILKGVPKVLTWFELGFVNGLGLPFNLGFLTGAFVVFILPILLYLYLIRRKKTFMAQWVLYFFFVMIGLSSYSIVVIRSADNPPVDMNNPEDPFALEYYLNREQYGGRPLFYGQSFLSPVIETSARNSYQRVEKKYSKYPLNPDVIFDSKALSLFPRLASSEHGHPEAYRFWTGQFHGNTIGSGEGRVILPSFADNIRFFIEYQLGHMYFRYFMWNFSGRQNDVQGRGNSVYGNWISGFKWFDQLRLGTQEKIPGYLKNNAGYNRYFMLPLVLGLLGLIFHYRKDRAYFFVAFFFFLLTGAAIVVYLNEVPVTPRERDYVYVGSFYVFAVWIGIGIMALFTLLNKRLNVVLSIGIAGAIGLMVPGILLYQNFDDHNRSGRYAVLEYARNLLESCEPNAILFTNADNDTYPLWYAQEVEGIRRDIRLVLTPYLSAEWYVDQMRKPQYSSEGLKMKLTREKYLGGKRSFIPVIDRIDSAVDIDSVIEFISSDDDRVLVDLQNGGKSNYLPSRKVFLKGNIGPDKVDSSYVSSINIKLSENYLRMDELVMLDIIATNNWERPVYFASEQVPIGFGLEKYLRLDGFAYKLTIAEHSISTREDIGYIDTELLYNRYMKTFSFESWGKSGVYLDNTHVYTINTVSLRNRFARLAEKLIQEGKIDKAEAVLDKIVAMLPENKVPFDYSVVKIAGLYFQIQKIEKGNELFKALQLFCSENIEYYRQLRKDGKSINEYDENMNLYMVQLMAHITASNKLVN